MSDNKTNDVPLQQAIMQVLDDKKGEDVLAIDVRGRCAMTDHFIIATGRNSRHLKALGQAASEVGHRYNLNAHIEGLEALEWLLVDLGDAIVHIFTVEARANFQLEKLWEPSDNRTERGA
ncbi:MAG: ribosome silencing factor [Mariprofundaceae bacterium]